MEIFQSKKVLRLKHRQEPGTLPGSLLFSFA